MQLTPFTNYMSQLSELRGYTDYLNGCLNSSVDDVENRGTTEMLCTTTDVLDRQLAFSKMLEEGYSRVLFTPDPVNRPVFSSMFYATDHHPNDPDWVRMVTEQFPGKLTVLHIDRAPTDIEQDVFLQHSERVLQQIVNPVSFRLLHGSDPVEIILETALIEHIDLLIVPCSAKAMIKNLSGEGFVHRILDKAELPVVIFKS
jgi:nucleotide-binding universal stress UspA family protein